MNAELGCDHLERLACPVSRRGQLDGAVGHLAGCRRTMDSSAVQVLMDRGPMDTEPCGHRVDRRAFAMEPDDLVDIALGQPSLNRV